jgi:hypothetical protein
MTKQIDELMALATTLPVASLGSQQSYIEAVEELRIALETALNSWKQLSMAELAAENHSAMEYCKHWEDRALKAEAAMKPAEPVAKYIGECADGSLVQLYDEMKKGTELYAAPPQCIHRHG